MKKVKFFILAVVLAAGFASCANPDKVQMVAVEDASMRGLAGMDLTARFDNQSCHKVNVKRGNLTLSDRGKVVVEVVLAQNVVIPRHSEQSVVFPLTFVIPNPFALLTLPNKISRGSEDLVISGEIVATSGIAKKKETIGPMSLSQFLYQMGISGSDISKYIGL